MGRKLDLLPKILAYPNWRHRIHLGNGVYTPGYNTLENDWDFYHMPENVQSKSVLDLGANDGYYSFTAEKNGAAEVTATDIYWGDGSTMVGGWPIEGIGLLKQYFNSKIEIIPQSVYELQQTDRKWDIVLCNDLLSWLDDIPRALKVISNCCNEQLVIHDTFSIDKKNRDIQIKQIGIAKLHRMHIDFLKKKLVELGFKKVEVKKVYSYKHYEWQAENIPIANVKNTISVYSDPLSQDKIGEIGPQKAWVLQEFKSYAILKEIGWVKTEDIQIDRFVKKKIVKVIKKCIPDYIQHLWSGRKNQEKLTLELVVRAYR